MDTFKASDTSPLIGTILLHLPEVDSTNDYARTFITKNRPSEGTVIMAHHQKHGRGQYGRRWESASGKNLTFTVILYPQFLHPSDVNLLSQAVSISLCDFFNTHLNLPVKIKWPNDIYYQDGKLAGVLIETSVIGNKLDYVLVGIGVNVNQTEFSPEVPNPVSLKDVFHQNFDLMVLLKAYFPFLDTWYYRLKIQPESLPETYSGMLYHKDEQVVFSYKGTYRQGILRGVQPNGRLLVEMNGVTEEFSHGEITFA
ncbi:MAG: biotin--[acetyl-CoA-carboxylase] ligase [Chitinophagales bacterium]|nr:MAG: biotin--[acetyl-CoA-carboxylase] ligase [Chitinophagales bacterium]